MARGRDLITDHPGPWGGGGSALLLNPRLPAPWRERVLSADFPDWDDHVWLATSGTGGTVKLVGLSRSALEASARAASAHLGASSRDVWINPLPVFHVGGLGILVRAALDGARYEAAGPWDPGAFVRRASEVGATLTSLVPAQVHDLVGSGLTSPPDLRAAVVGGGALDERLRTAAAALGWPLLPSYGLTEACSQVATARPGEGSLPWLPLLPHAEARADASGALALRGPSLLTGWLVFGPRGEARLEDPKAGGWLITRDRAEVRGREIRPLGRLDDLIKIRGELVDLAALERQLQQRVPSGAVRIDTVPDARNGASLHVVAESEVAALEARAAGDIFPPFARPESVQVGPVERSALGKIIRNSAATDAIEDKRG